MQRNKSTSKAVAHIGHLLVGKLYLQLACEPVRLVLESPAHRVHRNAHHSLERCQQHLLEALVCNRKKAELCRHLVQQEGNDSRRLCGNGRREVECAEKRGRMKERKEEREDRENVHLGNQEKLRWVQVIPVTEFVRWG